MDTIQDQIRELRTSARRQRFAIVTLASILAGSALIGAVRPAGDATFDTITCKAWRVVDEDGNVRIGANTNVEGSWGPASADGELAGVVWMDKDRTVRMKAGADTDGNAFLEWNDKDGKYCFRAGTNADGTVTYPTKGRQMNHTMQEPLQPLPEPKR